MAKHQQATHDHVLRPAEVAQRLGIGRPSVYTLVNNGLLPPPLKIGVRSSGWLASTIDDFLDRARRRADSEFAARRVGGKRVGDAAAPGAKEINDARR
jgi:prophage regulatory protein